MSQPVVTRFAPSPTGMLHIGGVRTALFCWLLARKHQGTFILRVEDTDLTRSTDDNIRIIEEGMEWVGLDWDEGPVPGDPNAFRGPHGPYRQMLRMDLYRARIQELLDRGLAYRCRCTREELDQRRQEAEREGRPFLYDGRCRDRHWDDFGARRHPPGACPRTGEIVLDDLVKGDIAVPADSLDDWIIARMDGTPTYNFCVVVDDTDMGVTHVVRGDDHVANTPKQIALYRALGYELPAFAHVPMILGKDKQKLSKRHGAASITEFRDLGFLPAAVRLTLAKLSWTPKAGRQGRRERRGGTAHRPADDRDVRSGRHPEERRGVRPGQAHLGQPEADPAPGLAGDRAAPALAVPPARAGGGLDGQARRMEGPGHRLQQEPGDPEGHRRHPGLPVRAAHGLRPGLRCKVHDPRRQARPQGGLRPDRLRPRRPQGGLRPDPGPRTGSSSRTWPRPCGWPSPGAP